MAKVTHLKAVDDAHREHESDQEILAAAVVALRRCQATGIPRHAKRAIESVEELIDDYVRKGS